MACTAVLCGIGYDFAGEAMYASVLTVVRATLVCMSRVAEQLKALDREALRAMSPTERIRLAFELGERDVVLYQQRTGLSREDAIRAIKRQRAHGRQRSACMEALLSQ